MRWRCDKTGAAIHTWFCADPVSRKGDGTFSESVCCRGSDVVEDTKGHGCSDSLYECCGFSKDSSGSQKNKDESQNREKIWIALLFLAQQKKEGFFLGMVLFLLLIYLLSLRIWNIHVEETPFTAPGRSLPVWKKIMYITALPKEKWTALRLPRC